MPLGFQTINRGVIPFGFFHIDTDLMIMDHYFLFAVEFCRYISEIAEHGGEGHLDESWGVYYIVKDEEIGDLAGAIHGIRYEGLIGELYKKFPFPKREEDFKQKPDGEENRAVVEPVLKRYAKEISIGFYSDMDKGDVSIGKCIFRREIFQELILYIWRGGYPRWKDEVRPDCVLEMKDSIKKTNKRLFKGIAW